MTFKKENPKTFQMLINIHSKTKSVYDAKNLQKNIQKCWNRKKNGIANTGSKIGNEKISTRTGNHKNISE